MTNICKKEKSPEIKLSCNVGANLFEQGQKASQLHQLSFSPLVMDVDM